MHLRTLLNTIFILMIINLNTAIGELRKFDSESDSVNVEYVFNPVVVTATKIAGTQRDLVASISIIDSQILLQTPNSAVMEVVKNHVPGLYVTEWGVMGYGVAGSSAGKISIRGVGGGANTNVLILRNGRPDFMGLMGCTIADEFALDGVERIEVLRGPASFLYGTNATGGVINIVSKSMTEQGFKTRITSGFGSFNSRKLSASHGGRINNFEYLLTAATRHTNGHRDFSDYEGDHYTAHCSYSFGTGKSVEMNTTLANINLFDPGTDSNPNIDHWYGISRYGGDLTFTLRNRFGESYLKLHSNFGKHKFYDGWRSRDQTLGIMVYHNLSPIKGNTSTIGFDIKRYGGNAENVSNAIDFGEYYITEWAPYFHCQQLMFERFIASAGLRLEHHNLYGYEILPKVGLVTHVTSSTSIRISAAKGFRSPSIRELHFFPPQNSDLDPERIQNYEIGFNQYLGYRIKLETVIFRSEGNNLIRRSNPGFPFEWTNSGKFTHTGYEILFQWLPWDQLETGISWTKLDLGNETLYSPGKKLTAYLNYQFRGMTFSGNLLHVKDLYGMDDRQLHMDDYTLLNISLQMELFKTVRIKGTLNNVLNAKYQAMFDYPMPGRYFTIEMGFVF